MQRQHILTIVCSVVLAVVAHADEIELRGGKVLTEVTVVEKAEGRWKVRVLDGAAKWIAADEIVSHAVKDTALSTYEERLAALPGDDLEGLVELARWAREKGLEKSSMKLCHHVLATDSDNAAARGLLGARKGRDGKWRRGRELERYEKGLEEERKLALGWKKIGGQWVDGYTAKCRKAGLVLHDGVWRTKKTVARLKRGQTMVDGVWYSKGDLAKLEKGLRKTKGGWKSIEKLDAAHRDEDNPWRLASEHLVAVSTLPHRKLSRLLAALEGQWAGMREFFGDEPLVLEKDDRLELRIFRERDQMVGVLNEEIIPANDNRVFAYGDSIGAIYDAAADRVVGYRYSDEYLEQWCRHALALAYMSRLAGYDRLGSNGFEMIGSYFEGMSANGYHPSTSAWEKGLRDWKDADPIDEIARFLISPKDKTPLDIERDFARLGFVVHFARQARPDVFEDWKNRYMHGRAHHGHLVNGMLGYEMQDWKQEEKKSDEQKKRAAKLVKKKNEEGEREGSDDEKKTGYADGEKAKAKSYDEELPDEVKKRLAALDEEFGVFLAAFQKRYHGSGS